MERKREGNKRCVVEVDGRASESSGEEDNDDENSGRFSKS